MIRPVLPSRRAMLGFVAVPGLAALAAPTVFASSRPLTISTPFSAPICQAAVEVPVTVLPGTPRKLTLTWNASAIGRSQQEHIRSRSIISKILPGRPCRFL